MTFAVLYDIKMSFDITFTLGFQALLSGCSAGGLATLIHCDDFRKRLPQDVTAKCLADAGFFLDEYVYMHRLFSLNFMNIVFCSFYV